MDIQLLTSLKILIIGDYCKDIYKYGSVDRLSPEAPVPILNLVEEEVITDGMAGNVYNNIKALNATASLVVSNKNILKIRYIDKKTKQHLLRVDHETACEEIKLDLKNINTYNAIVISDYDKGSIRPNTINTILKHFNGVVFVDSKKKDLNVFKKCIIKINEHENKSVIKFPNNSKIIVTLGENGALYNNKMFPTKKVEVFDVCGAGDSFMAGLSVQYLLTKNIEDAINFANTCASNVVKKSGTSVLNFDEVKNDIRF